MPKPTQIFSTTRPVQIPWEEAQVLIAKSKGAASSGTRPKRISWEEAQALIAKRPPLRAPLFTKPVQIAVIDPLDRRK